MGLGALQGAGFAAAEVVHAPSGAPSAEDTRIATGKFLAARVDLVLFCGGDGTARDICVITGDAVPVLGIPPASRCIPAYSASHRTVRLTCRRLNAEVPLSRVRRAVPQA
jgi:predicted polyphosphate/ATP-dependent NAD kinase